ncbi:MAG: TorF family putative porin [Verrucomicrobia bacterium]|nr:TorF family putative porin [Verrucomicrobiota bacterium]
MKKSLAILASSLIGLSAVNAQELEVTATVGAEGLYVFRGVQLANSISTASVDIAYGGFYAGIWGAFPLTRSGSLGATNEVDYYAGFVFPVSDLVSLDVGFTYYTYPEAHDLFKSGGDFEIFVGGSFDVAFSPSLYVYYGLDGAIDKNLVIEVTAGESWEVAPQLSLDLGVFAGWTDLDDNTIDDDYFYYGVSAGLTYSLTEAAAFSVTANWSGADTNKSFNGKSNKAWIGASLSVGF